MSEQIKTDNFVVNRMAEIMEPHFNELLELMDIVPRHNNFWDNMKIAFYNLAIKKTGYENVSALAKLMNMNRTTLQMALKRLGYKAWLINRNWKKGNQSKTL